MIIANTTFVIERELLDSFLQWLKSVYLPTALGSNVFSSSRVAKVLTNESPEVVSIACELTGESLSEIVRWHQDNATVLRAEMSTRWGERVLYFTTYLDEVMIN